MGDGRLDGGVRKDERFLEEGGLFSAGLDDPAIGEVKLGSAGGDGGLARLGVELKGEISKSERASGGDGVRLGEAEDCVGMSGGDGEIVI